MSTVIKGHDEVKLTPIVSRPAENRRFERVRDGFTGGKRHHSRRRSHHRTEETAKVTIAKVEKSERKVIKSRRTFKKDKKAFFLLRQKFLKKNCG